MYDLLYFAAITTIAYCMIMVGMRKIMTTNTLMIALISIVMVAIVMLIMMGASAIVIMVTMWRISVIMIIINCLVLLRSGEGF